VINEGLVSRMDTAAVLVFGDCSKAFGVTMSSPVTDNFNARDVYFVFPQVKGHGYNQIKYRIASV
jgi:hypothetical protein